MDKHEDNVYRYSAPTESERREVESIRRRYIAPSENESIFRRLVALDRRVKRIPHWVAIITGVVGLMIFGLGMSLALSLNMMAVGVVVSLIGMIIMLAAYPLHKLIINKLKQKHSEEVMKLSEQILGHAE